jgi:hypothetical protein
MRLTWPAAVRYGPFAVQSQSGGRAIRRLTKTNSPRNGTNYFRLSFFLGAKAKKGRFLRNESFMPWPRPAGENAPLRFANSGHGSASGLSRREPRFFHFRIPPRAKSAIYETNWPRSVSPFCAFSFRNSRVTGSLVRRLEFVEARLWFDTVLAASRGLLVRVCQERISR